MIEVTEKIIVDPTEVCSVQEEIVREYIPAPISDGSMHTTFEGSVMTLKNGRKIYIKGMTPKQINEKLFPMGD